MGQWAHKAAVLAGIASRRFASRCGGITAPELRASCHYCCYFPLHEKIRRLGSFSGLVRAFQNATAGED